MSWKTQKTSGGVVLATKGVDEKGNPKRVTFQYPAEARMATELSDFVEVLGSEQLCLDILNTKLARDAVESTDKASVRDTVLEVEQELLAENPDIDPDDLLKQVSADKRVKAAVKKHVAEIEGYVWSGTRASGGITKTKAAEIGKRLLEDNPERLKELAAELGYEDIAS